MRNKSFLLIFAAGMTAACLGSAARAEPVPPTLQARYAALTRAFEKRDARAYATFFDRSFVVADPSGKATSRTAYLAEVSKMLKTAKKATLKIAVKDATSRDGIVDVSFDATRIVISRAQQAEIDAAPKSGPQVSNVPVFHESGVDSWKKVGKTWVKVKTTIKTVSSVL